MKKKVIEIVEYLSDFVTEKRYEGFISVLNQRTNYITVALEDIYQSQNANAVLRTCDCFGIQNVHIIENQNQYQINPDVSLGSSKWLNLNFYNREENNTINAINTLRAQGYRIVATTPHTDDVNLEEFDLEKGKFALFFGSELPGLSNLMLDNADEYLKIPMYGFTESFNISVSAAICLHYLRLKLNNSNIEWGININEKNEILFNWLMQSIKSSDQILRDFLEK
jgi:tRNA (guanosine-2'-O-)-methyltransferase